MSELNEISPLLQASSIYLNSKNIKRQQKNLEEQVHSSLALEKLRQEGQLKMAYMTQEFQKNSRWEEANLRKIDQHQYQKDEYILRAHQQRLERMKVSYYTPTEWIEKRFPHAPAPFVIISLNPYQEHNPFKTEAVRIAPFSRIAHRLKERNKEHRNRLFTVVTTQEGFSSDDEVFDFYNRELNCPCIVIYGEFTGSSFVVNALYAGMEQNQIKFEGNKPKDLGADVVRVWEVSYKTIDTLKQSYAQKGDKYGWLEALETYTETHVGLFIQLMLDNLFSYSPRHVYEIKAPLFLREKEEELTHLGIWKTLKTSLLERYEVLRKRQNEASRLTEFSVEKATKSYFCDFYSNSLVLFDDGTWGFNDDAGKFYKPFFVEGDSYFSSKALNTKNENGKIGFITSDGRINIPFEYEESDLMREGFVAVKKNKKWGLLNFNGEIVLPFVYKYLRSPIEGKIIFRLDNDHVGLMNTDGKLCVEAKFSDITDLVDGVFLGHSINNENITGIYSVNGKELMPQLYYSLRSSNLGNGFFVLARNKEDKQRIINVLNMQDTELQYLINAKEIPCPIEEIDNWEIDISYCTKFIDNYTVIRIIVSKVTSVYFLLSIDGNLNLITYQHFRPIQDCILSEGLITGSYFMGFGKSGFLKTVYPKPEYLKSGYVIHYDFQYDKIFPFKEGLAVAKKNQKYGFINEQNETAIPFEYDFAMSFSEGIAPVAHNGKMGFINKNNVNIIPFCFDLAQKFHDGCALVCLTSSPNARLSTNKWAIINKEGKILVM